MNVDQADMFGDRRGLREGCNEDFALEALGTLYVDGRPRLFIHIAKYLR